MSISRLPSDRLVPLPLRSELDEEDNNCGVVAAAVDDRLLRKAVADDADLGLLMSLASEPKISSNRRD